MSRRGLLLLLGVLVVFPRRDASIQCSDAGTAARFLLAATAITQGTYHIDGSATLRTRPLAALIDVLRVQGAVFQPGGATALPLTIQGVDGLEGGDIEIASHETGQFASALLMIAPFAKRPVTLHAEGLVSRPYVQMTCRMMAAFGVPVQPLSETRFAVATDRHYQATDYTIEPDVSTASYFFAAAAVTGGTITMQPIQRQTDIGRVILLF